MRRSVAMGIGLPHGKKTKKKQFVQNLASGEQVSLKSVGNHYWRVKIQKNLKVRTIS